MQTNKVGKYPYVVEPFHADYTGHLFMGVLGNHLLNSAGFHATERGFGIANLNESHYTWVLSRLAIELHEMPTQYAEYTVETWIEKVYRLFTDRNFAITDQSGRVYGYARSVWAMIDLDTRKPTNLLDIKEGTITHYIETQKECPIEPPSRIKLSKEATLLHTHRTQYTDIDINGHVNSIKYIEHILNLFPRDTFETKRLKRLDIAYVTESYFGDKLCFYNTPGEGENEYELEVKRQREDTNTTEETVCRAKFVFTDK